MAGRHRKPTRPRHARRPGRHRKPPPKALTAAPAAAAVAVLAVGGVGFGHAIARGQAPRTGSDLVGPTVPAGVSAVTPSAPFPLPPTGSATQPAVSPPAVSGTSAVRPSSSPSPTPPPASPPPSSPPSPPARHPAASQHRRPPAALRIIDIGPACYVEVSTRHGDLLTRTILHGGQHLVFRRHGLTVVLGNAGGVRISVDGHRPRIAGESGQVRTIRER